MFWGPDRLCRDILIEEIELGLSTRKSDALSTMVSTLVVVADAESSTCNDMLFSLGLVILPH